MTAHTKGSWFAFNERNLIPAEDVVLGSGVVVSHRAAGNGSREAFIEGQPEMTPAQWDEYCAIQVARARTGRNVTINGRSV